MKGTHVRRAKQSGYLDKVNEAKQLTALPVSFERRFIFHISIHGLNNRGNFACKIQGVIFRRAFFVEFNFRIL